MLSRKFNLKCFYTKRLFEAVTQGQVSVLFYSIFAVDDVLTFTTPAWVTFLSNASDR